MARIRTIKPEMARHRPLFDLERDTGINFRFAWAMFSTVCDREGRFRWRPWEMKLDILPYDDSVDFSRVLDALAARGFVVKYSHQGELYGYTPGFARHQVVNNREKASEIPAHNAEGAEIIKVEFPNELLISRESHACSTRLFLDQGEGKGKEGKGKELKVNSRQSANTPNLDVARFIGAYVKAFQAIPGHGTETRPDLQQKVIGEIQKYLVGVSIERACELIQVYCQMDDPWFKTKAYDFTTFASNQSKIGVALDTGQTPGQANPFGFLKQLEVAK